MGIAKMASKINPERASTVLTTVVTGAMFWYASRSPTKQREKSQDIQQGHDSDHEGPISRVLFK